VGHHDSELAGVVSKCHMSVLGCNRSLVYRTEDTAKMEVTEMQKGSGVRSNRHAGAQCIT